jgi:hypothetical protein
VGLAEKLDRKEKSLKVFVGIIRNDSGEGFADQLERFMRPMWMSELRREVI